MTRKPRSHSPARAEAKPPRGTRDQRLLDIAARADAREGIRQGLEEARAGKGRPVRQFFVDFKIRHGLSAGRPSSLLKKGKL